MSSTDSVQNLAPEISFLDAVTRIYAFDSLAKESTKGFDATYPWHAGLVLGKTMKPTPFMKKSNSILGDIFKVDEEIKKVGNTISYFENQIDWVKGAINELVSETKEIQPEHSFYSEHDNGAPTVLYWPESCSTYERSEESGEIAFKASTKWHVELLEAMYEVLKVYASTLREQYCEIFDKRIWLISKLNRKGGFHKIIHNNLINIILKSHNTANTDDEDSNRFLFIRSLLFKQKIISNDNAGKGKTYYYNSGIFGCQ